MYMSLLISRLHVRTGSLAIYVNNTIFYSSLIGPHDFQVVLDFTYIPREQQPHIHIIVIDFVKCMCSLKIK